MLRRLALLLVLVALASCTPRGNIYLVDNPDARADRIEVFLGTMRVPEPAARFSGERSRDLYLGRYTVAIPPNRAPGQISYPRRVPDLSRDAVTTSVEFFDQDTQFTKSLAQRLNRKPPGKRSAVIFVHGYNNTFAEGLYRAAYLTHDFGVEGVTLHYSWPSAGSPFAYARDRDSTLLSRTGFRRFLDNVVAANPEEILIVAHSMGSLLTMETLRQMALESPGRVARDVRGLVLFSPDIDVDVFHSQVHDIGQLPRNVIVFTSQRDRALLLAARISGERERLGNIRSIEDVADLNITVLDVTGFSRGLGHFTPGTSPELIRLLRDVPSLERALGEGAQGRPGLLPGTVITVQNATEIILSPLTALAGQ